MTAIFPGFEETRLLLVPVLLLLNNLVMTQHENIVGWREWLSLPELGIEWIKAKVDTGARTSALHAFELDEYMESGLKMVSFSIHPLQKREDIVHSCVAAVVDERVVSDSGGHREKRYVISTPVRLGEHEWPIEVTLTNRDSMLFRMLLGRTAMAGRFLVQPEASFLFGRPEL